MSEVSTPTITVTAEPPSLDSPKGGESFISDEMASKLFNKRDSIDNNTDATTAASDYDSSTIDVGSKRNSTEFLSTQAALPPEARGGRLSRRTSEPGPPDVRTRSKTPIMGHNVPRLARHHSEELLIGLPLGPEGAETKNDASGAGGIGAKAGGAAGGGGVRRHGRQRSRGRRTSGGAASIEIAATNHHRTASIRRNREKRKRKEAKRRSQTNLLDGVDGAGDGNRLKQHTYPKQSMTTPVTPREPAEESDRTETDREARTAATAEMAEMREKMEFYKRKFLELEGNQRTLENKIGEKEGECSKLQNELTTVKSKRAISDEAKNKAKLLIMNEFGKNSHLFSLKQIEDKASLTNSRINRLCGNIGQLKAHQDKVIAALAAAKAAEAEAAAVAAAATALAMSSEAVPDEEERKRESTIEMHNDSMRSHTMIMTDPNKPLLGNSRNSNSKARRQNLLNKNRRPSNDMEIETEDEKDNNLPATTNCVMFGWGIF